MREVEGDDDGDDADRVRVYGVHGWGSCRAVVNKASKLEGTDATVILGWEVCCNHGNTHVCQIADDDYFFMRQKKQDCFVRFDSVDINSILLSLRPRSFNNILAEVEIVAI